MLAALRSEKVLVIDDDEQSLKMTARMLRAAGYDVVTRCDVIGTSAAVAAHRPQMVLIDLNMPTINGDRLAPLVRRAINKPPLVVLYSGTADHELRERAAACCADAVIPKGLTQEQFLARVGELLGNHPTG